MINDMAPAGRKLGRSFYTREDVVLVARELLGKILYTNEKEGVAGGIITETEAYAGVTDRASHAYNHRRTRRTEVMYQQGGIAYVYLCYGIHHLFNVVTNLGGVPHAVLIRSIHPVWNRELMAVRLGKQGSPEKIDTTGPGRLSKALGITVDRTGVDLLGDRIWLEEGGITAPDENVVQGPRIGVDYAGEDAMLPYRFTFDRTLPG